MRKGEPPRSSSRLCCFRPLSAPASKRGRRTCTRTSTPPRRLPRRPAGAARSAKLDAFWMPFTASRQFKSAPRLLAKAKDMHYWTPEGRQVLDAVAGLWCVNAGHARPKIVAAIAEQAAEMDFAPPFNMAHPKAFELAEQARRDRPRRPRQGVLHQLRLGGRRHRAQDGDRLPPRPRRRPAHPPDRPRARLPRRQLRRHLGRRHRRQPQELRHHGRRRRPPAPHPRPARRTRSRAACPSTAPSSPTTSSASSRCTTPRRSPP